MTTAVELSGLYRRYLETVRLPDSSDGFDFGSWLDRHWTPTAVPMTELCAGDFSEHPIRPGEINWVEHGALVIGFRAGHRHGYYVVSSEESAPGVALMLDDAEGCSTGTVWQERAFTRAAAVDVELVVISAAAALGDAPARLETISALSSGDLW